MWGKDDNLIWNIKTPKETNVKRILQERWTWNPTDRHH
jgi:hypothetical protein